MKRILSAFLVLTLSVGCTAQQDKTKPVIAQQDNQAKPKTGWKVNKQYDEKGNLISYDSTYTWSYSSGTVNNIPVDADSVITAMQKQFSASFPAFFNWEISMPGSNGQLNSNMGFDDILKRHQQHFQDMEKMMRSLDSTGTAQPPSRKLHFNLPTRTM